VVRDVFDAMSPLATGGAYVNFLSGDEGAGRLRAAYGEDVCEWLAKLEATWDPGNVFHLNQNIEPSC